MGSQSYKDLVVWQKSIALCTQVYKLCEKFPRSELYGLTDQMKRAAVSVDPT
jgi:four helix bundle protein